MSAPGSRKLRDILDIANGVSVTTPNGELTLRLFGNSQDLWFSGRSPWHNGSESGRNFADNDGVCRNTIAHRYLICLAAKSRFQEAEIASLKHDLAEAAERNMTLLEIIHGGNAAKQERE